MTKKNIHLKKRHTRSSTKTRKPRVISKRWWNFFDLHPLLGYGALTILLVLVVATLEQSAQFLKGSVLESRVTQFDGTCMPLQKVPDWFKTGGQNSLHYDNYRADQLTDFPTYDPIVLQSESDDPKIVNNRLTYSVAYLSTYAEGRTEGTGSHPAVDIRAPIGTPLFAVANGIVTKVEERTTGFGKNVVIKVPNAPLSNGTKEDIYVGYAHLSQIDVQEGQLVTKCQKIGEIGNTGTSTTPHLHFQIDSENSPWQMYWPFTSGEAAAAGLSFWDAVNSGLNIDKARQYTHNPMKWVQFHLSGSQPNTNNIPDISPPTPSPDTDIQDPNTPQNEDLEFGKFDEFVLSMPSEIQAGNRLDATITALDRDERIVRNFDEDISVTCSDSDASVTVSEFTNGIATLSLIPTQEGSLKCTVTGEDDRESERTVVLPGETLHSSPEPEEDLVDHFEIIPEDTVVRSGKKTILTIIAKNSDGETIRDFLSPQRFSLTAESGKISETTIQGLDFQQGEKEVIFTAPERAGSYTISIEEKWNTQIEVFDRVEPVYSFGIEPEDDRFYLLNTPKKLTITTLDKKGNTTLDSVWGTIRMSFLEGEGEITPSTLTSDDFTKGKATVTVRVTQGSEAIIKAHSGVLVGETELFANARDIFTDVSRSHPHSRAIEYLRDQNIINGYPDGSFRPNQILNRAEVAKMLVEAFDIRIDSGRTFLFDIREEEWFYDYVVTAERNRIVNGYPDKSFQPARYINRAEFFKMLLETNGERIKRPRTGPFLDVAPEMWFSPYADYALSNDLLEFDEFFSPDQQVTRGEVAEAMYRLLTKRP